MKDIKIFDIQSLLEKKMDISYILRDVKIAMEKDYPDFYNWFNNKVIPGLENGTRNIIVMYKKNKLIGFTNLKKTEKEKKMSNLTVKSSLFYEKQWNLIVNEALNWLETEDPVIIMSKLETYKSINLIISRGWYLTDKVKNRDYILNRYDELESIKHYVKRKKAY